MRVLKYRKKVDTKKSKGGDHKNPISEWKDKTYEKKKSQQEVREIIPPQV